MEMKYRNQITGQVQDDPRLSLVANPRQADYAAAGWLPCAPMPVPDGHRIVEATVQWTVIDGVDTQFAETEPIPPAPLYYAETWDTIAPLLDDHPATEDVPASGMFYRVPDPEDATIHRLFWWRQGDAVATQLSAHDHLKRPIIRTYDPATRKETTIVINELVDNLPPQARALAKTERQLPQKVKDAKR